MLLKKLTIEHFRGIAKLEIELDRTTVLIGENNTGKTSVLEALHLCMSRSLGRRAVPFSEYDFHLPSANADPTDAPPIVITLEFEELAKDEWPDEIVQTLSEVIQVLADDRQCVALQVTAAYDKAIGDFGVDWAFLDAARNPLPVKQQRLITDLQQLAPVFLLTAMREASQHFQPRSALWGPFTRSTQIADDKRKEIEDQVSQVNQSVLDSHKPFEVIKDRLAQTGKLVPLSTADLVSVEAVPARILDMLARTQVKLASKTGARLPIGQHGAGTQSLSVLFLFEAFVQSRLSGTYDKNSEPILALEEPESHLHPSAIRALWPTLDSFSGQRLIATHSGELLSAAPLEAIRRLARKNGEVQVFSIKSGSLDPDESRKVAYHIRSKRGSLLFARCWLFVEGESEFTMLPEFGRALQYEFEHEGVVCVEYSQCGLRPLIKAARDLGIEWYLLTDGDSQGTADVAAASAHLGSDGPADRITQLAESDIEHCLWDNGYEPIYENSIDANHKSMVQSGKGTPQYASEAIRAAAASTSKPYLAYAVAVEATKAGSPGVPEQIKAAIDTAVRLARKTG